MISAEGSGRWKGHLLFPFHERDLALMEYGLTKANSFGNGADHARVLLGATTDET